MVLPEVKFFVSSQSLGGREEPSLGQIIDRAEWYYAGSGFRGIAVGL